MGIYALVTLFICLTLLLHDIAYRDLPVKDFCERKILRKGKDRGKRKFKNGRFYICKDKTSVTTHTEDTKLRRHYLSLRFYSLLVNVLIIILMVGLVYYIGTYGLTFVAITSLISSTFLFHIAKHLYIRLTEFAIYGTPRQYGSIVLSAIIVLWLASLAVILKSIIFSVYAR